MSSSQTAIGWAMICALFLLSACKDQRSISSREYPSRTSEELVLLAQNTTLDFEQFSAKVSADVRSPKSNNSFRATLRIRKDSAIWVSVSPALGIEVFRVLCTQDSVLYVDKINKEFFRGTYKKLNEITNSDLTLNAIQDILVGNPLYFDPELKYRTKNDDEGYQLSTRNVNRLRRMVGTDREEGPVIPYDTTNAELNEKRLMRLQEKLDDEELIVRQYWFDYAHGKIVQSVFTDLASALYLSAVYDQFEEVDGKLIATKASLELGNTKEQATFKLDYSRIKLNEPLSMPFSIPDKYEQIRN